MTKPATNEQAQAILDKASAVARIVGVTAWSAIHTLSPDPAVSETAAACVAWNLLMSAHASRDPNGMSDEESAAGLASVLAIALVSATRKDGASSANGVPMKKETSTALALTLARALRDQLTEAVAEVEAALNTDGKLN